MSNPNTLIVPSGLPGLAPITIDLGPLNRAEARIAEVAALTPTKAPELLATFNAAYLEASRIHNQLEEESLKAQRSLDRIRAIIVLDRVPKVLHERGLATAKSPAGSEDLRKAVIDSDPDYRQAADSADAIGCYLALLKTMVKGFEMAFSSVRRVLGEQAFNYNGKVATLNLSAGADTGEVAGQTEKRSHGFAKHNRY